MKTEDAARSDALYLPDFCTSRATLAMVLIVELTALVLTLARQSAAIDFWTDLARTSMFLLWIGLAGAALLCALRLRLSRLTVAAGSTAVLLLISAVIAAVSLCAYLFGRTPLVVESGGAALFPASPRVFILFNSMNTIAALTRSNPPRAEEAVQDLADLFRATLADKGTITLAEELEVARTYQRMEQLRLGARLQVEWRTDALPADALVPGLVIQPLLENAIYHGIEPRPEGGTVTISGEVAAGLVTIVVRNPLDPLPGQREGHRLALANIRERLSLMYGERALMKSGRFDAEYIVTLRFPLIEKPAQVAAAARA